MFFKWNLAKYIKIKENPLSSLSTFLIIDDLLFLKLMYHYTNKWSFVKVTQHFKADPAARLIFLTDTNIYPLLECIYSFHQIIADIEYSANETEDAAASLPFLQ